MTRALISKTSDFDYSEIKDFADEAEMLDYCHTMNSRLVVTKNPAGQYMDPDHEYHIRQRKKYYFIDYEVELYDDYRE